MLVVGLDFCPPTDRKEESNVFCGATPFSGRADVVRFATDVGREMIVVNIKGSLHHQPVAVPPGEISINPPQVGPVPVGDQDARLKRKAWRRVEHDTIFAWFTGSWKTVVSDPKGQGPGLGFVELKDGESLQLEKRFRKHIEVGSELGAYRVARFLRSRCVKQEPERWVDFYIGVDLGPELRGLLRSCGRGCEQNEQNREPAE